MNAGAARAGVLDAARLAAAAAALFAVVRVLPQLDCWAVALALAVLAWPVWCHAVEQGLFVRRAILEGMLQGESRVRRWFWAGRVARVVQVLSALFWTALLLAIATLAGPWQWAALFGGAILLGLALRPVARWLERDVQPGRQGLAARRWPLLVAGTAFLAIAFFVVDYFISGAPDTRGLAWLEVAERAYATASAPYACVHAGALAGLVAGADALTWHAAEILIPSLPAPWLRGVAWLALLLQAGVLALVFTRLLLGVAALADRGGEATPPWRPYVATVAALAVLAWIVVASVARGTWVERVRSVVEWADPCRIEAEAGTALVSGLGAELEAVRNDERRRIASGVAAALDPLFARAEARVDAYLDWYFTIPAEYARLAAAATGGLAAKMQSELESRVFGEDFNRGLEQALGALSDQSRERLAAATRSLAATAQSQAAAKPCLAPRVDLAPLLNVERDITRASAAAGGGAAVGVAAGLAARRAAAAAAARAAQRATFRGAASLVGRSSAKRGGSALVAAIGAGAACGPLAPLCALAAGGATWIALDKAFIEVDKALFREAMRAEILAEVRAQKEALAADATALLGDAADASLARVREASTRVFIPARAGP